MFGYDNMAMSIRYCFIRDTLTTEEGLADAIHRGWSHNYIYWRDNKPWVTDSRYKKPFKELGDENRNMLSITSFKDLPKEEQEKDLIIARILIEPPISLS